MITEKNNYLEKNAQIVEQVERAEERTKEAAQPDAPDLKSELTSLLNRYSRENVSNTPDFILSDFMWDSLKAFERGVKHRDDCAKNRIKEDGE